MTDIFELATRKKLRFPSVVGNLTSEDVWDLPLRHATKPSIEALGIAARKEFGDIGEFSFVGEPSPRKELCELRLKILERIRDAKLADIEAGKQRVQNAALKEELLEIEGEEQKAKLRAMSPEERKALLAKL